MVNLFIYLLVSYLLMIVSLSYCYFEAPVGYPDRAGRRLSGACSFFLGLPSFIYSLFIVALVRGAGMSFFLGVVFYIIRG